MRFAAVTLGLFGVGALAAAGAGCGGGASDSSSDGATTLPDAAMPAAPCAPMASCVVANKDCLGLVDNQGKTLFGLRISQLDVSSPPAFARTIVRSTISGSVTPAAVSCNLAGKGTFSWLLQFDTTAGTIKTGGAKPVSDATKGYSFDDEMLSLGTTMFRVQPVTMSARPDASGNFAVTMGQDLTMPIFLDDMGNVIVLPLRQARIAMGTLSSNRNCIGSYNASTLDPANSCQPDSTHAQFTTAGKLDGYITLEEADTAIIAALKQSLCVVLSGDPGMYGTTDMSTSLVTCKRDGSKKIVYQGGWCSTTNAAAAAGCADAEQFSANFAASSVLIN